MIFIDTSSPYNGGAKVLLLPLLLVLLLLLAPLVLKRPKGVNSVAGAGFTVFIMSWSMRVNTNKRFSEAQTREGMSFLVPWANVRISTDIVFCFETLVLEAWSSEAAPLPSPPPPSPPPLTPPSLVSLEPHPMALSSRMWARMADDPCSSNPCRLLAWYLLPINCA